MCVSVVLAFRSSVVVLHGLTLVVRVTGCSFAQDVHPKYKTTICKPTANGPNATVQCGNLVWDQYPGADSPNEACSFRQQEAIPECKPFRQYGPRAGFVSTKLVKTGRWECFPSQATD